MIQELTIKNLTFPVNLIQGPLAGVSCAPFRRLTWQHSKPAFSCTEMISSKTLLYKPVLAQQRLIKKDPNEGPVCFQLAANDPKELAEATKRVTEYGADLIDLNCGCPVKKIRSKGMGSSLLSNPSALYQLIKAMKENTHLPISVKIRVQGHVDEKMNREIAAAVTDAGVDFLIVHGRHWTEHYETACRYDQIQFFAEELKIPVIGNGDIACIDSLKRMYATGCAGAMIGRAGVGQPWLIAKLIAEMKHQAFTIPNKKKIGELYLEHVHGLIALMREEKFAILQARKLGKYYARSLENRADFCEALNTCVDLSTLNTLCDRYFE